jgi:hypothetical protein
LPGGRRADVVPARRAAAFGTVAFFAVFGVIPAVTGSAVPADRLAAWQILFVVLISAYCCLVVAIGRSWSGRAGWGQQQKLAVITGALLPAIILSLLLPAALRELEPLATVPMLALLLWLARRTGATPPVGTKPAEPARSRHQGSGPAGHEAGRPEARRLRPEPPRRARV